MTKLEHIMGKYGEWIFRGVLLSAVMIQLYLTSNFVTAARYERDMQQNASAHAEIQTTVNDISATMKLLAKNELQLTDHETRIRVVEQRQTDVLARLLAVERMLDNK